MARSVGSRDRYYGRITSAHLHRLVDLTLTDLDRFYRAAPQYRRRLMAITLTQGAALHMIDGWTGVNDLDVYSFFAAIPGEKFPADRRQVHCDFGRSSLGRS